MTVSICVGIFLGLLWLLYAMAGVTFMGGWVRASVLERVAR